MTPVPFTFSAWSTDQTVSLEAWGHDRRAALQAGLDAVVALTRGEAAAPGADAGPVAPLRGEGSTLAALFDDLLDDLFAQIETHGPPLAVQLDGVVKQGGEGFLAWGYLSSSEAAKVAMMLERHGATDIIADTPEEIRLRTALRRLP